MASLGSEIDAILHDLLFLGGLAANIFVKNPQHRQIAGQVINAVNQALPVISAQIDPQGATQAAAPAPAPTT